MSAPTALQTLAPAKINLTLEVLGRRDDGFHEIASVVQTIDLVDRVRLGPAPTDLPIAERVRFCDPAGRRLPPPAGEIVARSWDRLRVLTGWELPGLVTIEKQIPVAGGLGGGSSDAASFLRLANRFWDLRLSTQDLAALAAEAGSDVPLFLRGGAVLMAGRGERLSSLPDPPSWSALLLTPELPLPEAKTATMFSALRPRHFSDGARSRALAAKLARGEAPLREDLSNTFDPVVGEVLLGVAAERRRLAGAARAVPLLAGAGPSLFLLAEPADGLSPEQLAAQLNRGGGQARVVRALPREEALALGPAPGEGES